MAQERRQTNSTEKMTAYDSVVVFNAFGKHTSELRSNASTPITCSNGLLWQRKAVNDTPCSIPGKESPNFAFSANVINTAVNTESPTTIATTMIVTIIVEIDCLIILAFSLFEMVTEVAF